VEVNTWGGRVVAGASARVDAVADTDEVAAPANDEMSSERPVLSAGSNDRWVVSPVGATLVVGPNMLPA